MSLLVAGVYALLSVAVTNTASITLWRTGYYSPIFPIGSGGMPASEVHYAAFTHIVHVTLIAADAQGGIDSTTYGLTPDAIRDFIARARAADVSPIVQLSQLAGFGNFLTQSINAGHLDVLVNNVMNYVTTYGYDGVDLDWEVDLGSNAGNFKALVEALRTRLSGKLLTASFGADESIAAANAANLDQVNLQCYDLASPAWGLVWHNSALFNLNDYVFPCCGNKAFTVQWRIGAHLAAGLPAAKIGVGIPFYGYVWNGGTAPGQTGGSYSSYPIDYRDLVNNPVFWQFAYMHRDGASGGAPYLSIASTNQFVTYSDPIYVGAQWSQAVRAGYGGLAVWEMGSDWNPSGGTPAQKHPLADALRLAAAACVSTAHCRGLPQQTVSDQ